MSTLDPDPALLHPPPAPPPPLTSTEPTQLTPRSRPPYQALLDALERTLNDRLTSDLGQVARRLGVSKRSLQRVLARAGVAFHALRDRLRLRRAEVILADQNAKVSAVASEVGFTSIAHFSAWFRRHHGLTPGAWRDRQSEARSAHPESDTA